MASTLSDVVRKGVAALILLAVAYVLFKVVVGAVLGLLWIVGIVLAVGAVIWALRVL